MKSFKKLLNLVVAIGLANITAFSIVNYMGQKRHIDQDKDPVPNLDLLPSPEAGKYKKFDDLSNFETNVYWCHIADPNSKFDNLGWGYVVLWKDNDKIEHGFTIIENYSTSISKIDNFLGVNNNNRPSFDNYKSPQLHKIQIKYFRESEGEGELFYANNLISLN